VFGLLFGVFSARRPVLLPRALDFCRSYSAVGRQSPVGPSLLAVLAPSAAFQSRFLRHRFASAATVFYGHGTSLQVPVPGIDSISCSRSCPPVILPLVISPWLRFPHMTAGLISFVKHWALESRPLVFNSVSPQQLRSVSTFLSCGLFRYSWTWLWLQSRSHLRVISSGHRHSPPAHFSLGAGSSLHWYLFFTTVSNCLPWMLLKWIRFSDLLRLLAGRKPVWFLELPDQKAWGFIVQIDLRRWYLEHAHQMFSEIHVRI
jgi:hypothetical protein